MGALERKLNRYIHDFLTDFFLIWDELWYDRRWLALWAGVGLGCAASRLLSLPL